MKVTSRIPSFFRIVLVLITALAVVVPVPASATLASSSSSSMEITCEIPGQIVEAGETASFDITVTNNGLELNRPMWYETYEGTKYDWEIKYMDGTKEINILSLPSGASKQLTVEIETDSETPVGKYSVRIHIGDGYYWLYVTISKTHSGEKGTLEMTVVDKDGEKIKGAEVTIRDADDKTFVDMVKSTADGAVSAQIVQGTYHITIGKTGYTEVEKKDVKIKGGITKDIGTIMLDKSLYAAEVTVSSPVLTTTASDNPGYDVTIKNSGKSDDTYHLSVEGAPDDWYFRFRESSGQTVDIADLFLKSGDEKDLTLEAILPYGVDAGDYDFTMLVDSSQAIYSENLTVKIRGDYDLKVYAEQYKYEVNKGGEVSFDLTVSNGGTAGALTNVEVSVTTPDGWNADIDPVTISGIQPGEQKTVTVQIVPPANIAASEYKISVTVKSDQTEQSDDFRIVVKEQSFIGILGILIVIAIGAGVVFMFRKYNRR